MSTKPEQYDVLIIGGGMVGASLGSAFIPLVQRFNLKVAVIEAFPIPVAKGKPQYQPSFDARSTALSFNSRLIFESMGVWDTLREHVTPIERIHVSDKGHFGSTRLSAEDHNIEALGYVIENAWMGRSLFAHLQEVGAVPYISPASVKELKPIADGASLTLEIEGEEKTVQTRLAVIADGGRSNLCASLNIGVEQKPYHQNAIIANVTTEKPHHGVAYERFTADGAMALLPLFDSESHLQNRFAMVYAQGSDDVEQVLALSDEEFMERIQDRFGYRLGRILKVGKRDNFPLTLQWAKEQTRSGIVVMGNAAHTLHPIAGQGFNLALRGVDMLTKTLYEASEQGKPLGSLDTLNKYLERQQGDQKKMIGFTDNLLRLFHNNDLLLSLVREAGMVAMDLMPPVKRLFSQHAMGLGDRFPPVS